MKLMGQMQQGKAEQAQARPPSWARDALACGGLALFVLALYAQLLFTNRVAASGDILYYFYPYRALAADALRAGNIPLWNPFIFMGAPLLANPQAAALYPLHWPLIGLRVTQQVAWSAALHTWILGVGGYALLRTWRLDRVSSLVGALVLAGSGFYGGLLGHLNQMNGAAWLPWAALLVARARHSLIHAPRPLAWGWFGRVGLPHAAGLGALVALMLLAGHTQTVYINLFGLGAWIVGAAIWGAMNARGYAWRVRLGDGARLLGVLALACGVGALASAAQLWPTLELSGLGLRSGGLPYNEASSFSLRPLYLAWTLLPSYGLADLGVIFGTLGYTEYVAYVGLFGLILAVGALIAGRAALRRAATGVEPGAESGTESWAEPWRFGLFFAGLGFFLALGRWNPFYYLLYVLVPGFDLFRAPARWMMLYTLGMAVLAALGCAFLLQRMGRTRAVGSHTVGSHTVWSHTVGSHTVWLRLGTVALVSLVAVELVLAARALPYTRLTAPQAVYDVRTAPAHLLTDPARTVGNGAMGRFLSMSAIGFDPGDMADYERILRADERPVLSAAAFDDLIVALKAQEILAPNLPMLWQVPSVDGFDGGTLPLQRYNEFLSLLIPREELVPDGRVREQLQQIPPARLLDLLNVQYVITDKVRDLWFEGVYYDRQLGATLTPDAASRSRSVTVDVPAAFPATHVDVIGALTPAEPDGLPAPVTAWPNRPVAQVQVAFGDAYTETLTLVGGGEAGAHVSLDALDSRAAAQSGATVAYVDVENARQAYRARLPLTTPLTKPGAPTRLVLTGPPETSAPGYSDLGYHVSIQAITLYDARSEMFLALTPSDRGRFRLVHSGDVKIYEYLDVMPRAHLVAHALPVADGAAALAQLARPDFAPGAFAVIEQEPAVPALPSALVLDAGAPLPTAPLPTAPPDAGRVEMLGYTPERIDLRVSTAQAALLVLSDVYYPGWRAWVGDRETPIYRANHLFRAVVVPPGEHTVRLRFRPASFYVGRWWSGAGILLLLSMWGAHRLVRHET